MRPGLLIGMTINLVVSLAACGSSASEATSATTSDLTTTTTAPTTTVAPTTTIEEQTGIWTESDLVFLTRLDDGATLTLDMHFPAEPAVAPIVIDPISPAVDDLVEQGAIVVEIDDDDHLGEGPGGPEALVAAGQDRPEKFECAVLFARAKASQLGNDDPTVVLSGVSQGGGLVAQVGLFGATLSARWDEYAAAGGPPRQFDCAVTGGSTHIDAVVGMAGTYDMSMPIIDGAYGRSYQQEHNPEMQEFLVSAIGANPDLKLRLIHGTNDFVPVEYVEEFTEMLTGFGYEAQLITWGGGHEEAPKHLFLPTLLEVLAK